MALDAVVYCDCFERGRLRSPPPPGCSLSVDESGFLLCGCDDLDTQIAFDHWQFDSACSHENGLLIQHRIGNIALVAALREALQETPARFPILLSRVLYNGTHCCDFIRAVEVLQLQLEVAALSGVHCRDPQMEQFMREFETQMGELVAASLAVGKPIVF
ncbi:MAG TPA: hypothetical protein VFG68_23400 [Fimbriiglobus sp.]|nr:hypothetical protein [Fimbriiglobus sp.]